MIVLKRHGNKHLYMGRINFIATWKYFGLQVVEGNVTKDIKLFVYLVPALSFAWTDWSVGFAIYWLTAEISFFIPKKPLLDGLVKDNLRLAEWAEREKKGASLDA